MKIVLIILSILISFLNAENLEKVSLQLKWKYQFQFAGFIAAYEKGFYKDIGLNVTLKEFTPDIDILEEITNENVDFAISDSALVYDALKGEPVTALMAVFQHSPFMLVGLNNGNIQSLKDLNNKIIALDEGTDGISIKAMLKTKNIEYKKHSPVFSLDKLLLGKIDMMSSYISNEPYSAKLMGVDIKTFLPRDYGFEGYGDILFTSKKMIKNNPELVNRFYKASLEGWKYAFTHKEELVDIIYNKYNSLEKSKKALLYEAEMLSTLSSYKNDFGAMNKEKIKSIAQQFNLVKNEHNKLEILDDFIYTLNNSQENKKSVNVLLGFDKPPYVKQLMTLTSLLSDISSKYIFEQKKNQLIAILKRFMIHPDIKAISIRNKNKLSYYTNLVRKENSIVEDLSFINEDLQKITSKIYYKTEFDLLNLGELSIYYQKDYKINNGKVIPNDNIFNGLKPKDYERIKNYYKKYKIVNEILIKLTPEEKEYLKKHTTITVHNEADWAPYNYTTNNQAKGFSIDYIELLAKKLNINIKYIQGYKWSDFLTLMEKEKIDVIANIEKNQNRDKYVNFTSSYIKSKKAIFSNIPNIKNISDLKGKTIALPKQFYTHNYLKNNYPSIKIKVFKDTRESLYAVINKEADALIENFAVVNTLMQKNGLNVPYITLNDGKGLISNLHIGVRKSQIMLRDIFEKAKQSVTEEEFNQLEQKWFGIKKEKITIFTNKELEYIKKKKDINICFHNQQEPWVINKNGLIKGYTVEFLKYVTKKSTLNFNFIETKNVNDHFKKVKNGTCDISPVIVTNPNKFDFLTPTIPFIEDNIVLVTKINEPFEGDLNDLKNKKIGIHKGKKSLIDYVKFVYPNINLVEIDDLDLDKIVNGEFYGYISASYKMSYMIYPKYVNTLKIMTKIGDKKVQGSFGITVREPILLNIFDKALTHISELEKQEIENAWVSVEVEKQFDYELFIQFISVFMVIFIILSISYLKQKKLKDRIQLLNNSLEQRVKIEVQKNREKDKLMLRQSRLAQMGEIISMIAHQWRQPLNSLSLLNQTVLLKYDRGKLNDETIAFFKEHSKKQINEMSKTIDDFRDFFKPSKIQSEFSLSEMIEGTISLAKPIFIAQNIKINFNVIENHIIMGHENELGQAMLNIFNNAKDALIENKIENKEVSVNIQEDSSKIEVIIKDNAGGIPMNIIDNIFDPYFSTKEEKNGTGLGLYMTKMIIEDYMQGKISVKNDDKGAVFRIALKK